MDEHHNIPQFYSPNLRIVDLNLLAKKLWCYNCSQALSLRNCVVDDFNVYRTVLEIKCLGCSKTKSVALSLLEKDGTYLAYLKQNMQVNNHKTLVEKCCEVNNSLKNINGDKTGNREIEEFSGQIEEIKVEVDGGCLYLNDSTNSELQRKGQHSENEEHDLGPGLDENNDFLSPNEPSEMINCDSSDEEKVFTGNKPSRKFLDGPSLDWTFNTESTSDKPPRFEVPENCLYCPEEFPNYRKASQHMKKNHPDYLNFKCGVCQKQCPSLSNFQSHIEKHRPSRARVCPHCGEMLRNAHYLRQHVQKHEKAVDIVPCPLCPKVFNTNFHLSLHIRTHKPAYTCDFCKKKIRQRGRLVEHIYLHIENKTYDCEICGAKFVRKDNRNTHMKNNHNLVCLVCFGKFKRAEDVKVHCDEHHSKQEVEASMVNGKPYEKVTRFQCPVCFRYLASKQSLKFHVARTHTGKDKK